MNRLLDILEGLTCIVVGLFLYLPEKLYRWILNEPYHDCDPDE